MRATAIVPEFVEYVPVDLTDGVLYVSIAYRTAVHRCACGCGNKVVTPISPADWQVLFDGDSVSLSPSIGNWGFPCRSHYWIRSNRVLWSGNWSQKQIDAGRARDQRDRERYFGTRVDAEDRTAPQDRPARQCPYVFHRLRRLFRKAMWRP
ncbi:DUF6527 family protein [Nocardia fluminea]|uniref:DUF6527 family protein n=1 Tax=Nocardia fluminea TaxID=134984 RepID=UPI00364A389C